METLNLILSTYNGTNFSHQHLQYEILYFSLALILIFKGKEKKKRGKKKHITFFHPEIHTVHMK